MSVLFNRQVSLQIGQPGQIGREFASHAEGKTGLRITFDVKMTATGEPTKATIKLYNPQASSVALATDEGALFRLFAGYRGKTRSDKYNPPLLFEGTGVKNGVWVGKTGPDRILEIEGLNRGEEYAFTRMNASWSTEATVAQVLDEVLSRMGLPRGRVDLPNDVRWPQGVVFYGPAHEILDRIADTQNAQWYLRDGVFYMIERGSGTDELAPLYSSDQPSLIGSPKQKENGIEVTTLLDPGMRPGRPFRVESAFISGNYVAGDVHHQGDSGFDNSFFTTITGRDRRDA